MRDNNITRTECHAKHLNSVALLPGEVGTAHKIRFWRMCISAYETVWLPYNYRNNFSSTEICTILAHMQKTLQHISQNECITDHVILGAGSSTTLACSTYYIDHSFHVSHYFINQPLNAHSNEPAFVTPTLNYMTCGRIPRLCERS